MPKKIPLGPTEHLTWNELACKDGTNYPLAYVRDGTCNHLADTFERIRALWGKPIEVLSAYRTPEHNKAIGGARNSQHVLGKALDLKPPKGVKLKDFHREIRNHWKEFRIGGIGLYKTFVHVDIRGGNRLVVWSGSGVKDS